MARAEAPSTSSLLGASPEIYLENFARRFPELLLALGAPNLEDEFEPETCRVAAESEASVFEVLLQRRSFPPQPNGVGQDHRLLNSLSRLASDFEQLALCAHVQTAVRQAASLAAPAAASEQQAPRPAGKAPPPGPPRAAAQPAAALARSPTIGGGGAPPARPPAAASQPPPAAADRPSSRRSASALPLQPPPQARSREAKERPGDRGERSPKSARGDRQVRQGGFEGGGSKCLGRTRGQRQPLCIAITKVQELQDLGQPVSPKNVVRRLKVWGASKRGSTESPPRERKALATQERIERRLRQMFSDVPGPCLEKRHSIS